MLYLFTKNQRKRLLATGVILCLLGAFAGAAPEGAAIAAGWLRGEQGGAETAPSGESAPTVLCRREAGGWAVWVTPGLGELGDGEAVALLLTLRGPVGEPLTVETGEGAAGLTLTVGKTDGGAVTVLLDGIPEKREVPAPALVITAENGAAWTEGAVWAEPCGESCLYRTDGSGGIERIRLRVVMGENQSGGGQETDVSPSAGDTSRPSDRPDGGRDPQETLTEEETAAENPDGETTEHPTAEDGSAGTANGTGDPPSDPPEPFPWGESVFLGCQETGPAGGCFAVRFLFSGESTPVLCASGGGVLTVETGVAAGLSAPFGEGGVVYGCVFRGLSSDKRYVFEIFSQGERILAIYENGKFGGFSAVDSSYPENGR